MSTDAFYARSRCCNLFYLFTNKTSLGKDKYDFRTKPFVLRRTVRAYTSKYTYDTNLNSESKFKYRNQAW